MSPEAVTFDSSRGRRSTCPLWTASPSRVRIALDRITIVASPITAAEMMTIFFLRLICMERDLLQHFVSWVILQPDRTPLDLCRFHYYCTVSPVYTAHLRPTSLVTHSS